MATVADVDVVPTLSGGKWRPSGSKRSGEVYNPSTGKLIGRVPFCTAEETDAIVRTAEAALASAEPGMEAAALTPPRAPEVRVIETRDDALRELGRIATFFREKEPHSPISYALETLIRRARLPLADLLRELIPDEAVRRSALNMAGITLDSTPGG